MIMSLLNNQMRLKQSFYPEPELTVARTYLLTDHVLVSDEMK